MNKEYPKVFSNQSIIQTREPKALLADALYAWALCRSGIKTPDSFGEVMVEIKQRLGMESALPECFLKYASENEIK